MEDIMNSKKMKNAQQLKKIDRLTEQIVELAERLDWEAKQLCTEEKCTNISSWADGGHFLCSECGTDGPWEEDFEMAYCPHCGAAIVK